MGMKGGSPIVLHMPSGAMATYRRLLSYLRPHLRMFMLGVLGMATFAATDAGWAAFVKFFLDGTFVDNIRERPRPGDEIMVLPVIGSKNIEVTRGISTILYQLAIAAKVVLDL